MKGLVTRSTGSWYTVRKEDGTTIECRIKGKFRIQGIKATNPVAVGDKVKIEFLEDGTGVIYEITDRKNAILRKATKLSSQTQIIAANIDQAVLMGTLAEPKTLVTFIDRFLITAEAYEIPVIIIFNKLDIYHDAQKEELKRLITTYSKIGYGCIGTSAVSGENVEEVKQKLKDKTTLVAGNSGVGKSTLINTVEPTLNLKTTKLSKVYETGTHTTTYAEMFELSFGGYIIDSPGVKSFGVHDFGQDELYHYFPEIFKEAAKCKFHNCLHINEPDCAVKQAVENQEIAEFRYESYLRIYNGDDLESEY